MNCYSGMSFVICFLSESAFYPIQIETLNVIRGFVFLRSKFLSLIMMTSFFQIPFQHFFNNPQNKHTLNHLDSNRTLFQLSKRNKMKRVLVKINVMN